MLTIKPIESKDEQNTLCASCSVEFRPDDLAYSCYEKDVFVGVCQFMLKGACVYLHDIATAEGIDDFGAKFIMGRAALNFADLSGFHDAYYVAPQCEKLARMIGFKKNENEEWYFDLRGFFESPCSCDKT